MTRYELPVSLHGEIDQYEDAVRQYRAGALNPVKFKSIRVPFGVYEQRKDDTYMVRIRCAAGIVAPEQLAVIAGLSQKYGNGRLHLTTRQGIQIHDVTLEDTIAVIRELARVGLTTRGTGGNTVRNVIASVDAGIYPFEPFDVTPYAVGLTSALIAEPDSWTLPRKYKIAFSNSTADTADATAADLGFIARIHRGQEGFKVYAAGGMGRQARVGHVLYDFIPTDKVYAVAKGLKRMFDTYGNRKNRHAARLRFLREKLGGDEFKRLLEQEIDAVERESKHVLTRRDGKGRATTKPDLIPVHEAGTAFGTWKRRYVREQKQKGLYAIKVPFLMGDVRSADALSLASFLAPFGDDVLRCSLHQNLHIRNIPGEFLGNLYGVVRELESLSSVPEVIANLSACAGAGACKLGITMPAGAVAAVRTKLLESELDLDEFRDVKIHLSGCPNSCGKHQIADLGFSGKGARNDGRLYPAYTVTAGGATADGKARCGETVGSVSAYDLPAFVHDALHAYLQKKPDYRSFSRFVFHGCAEHEGLAEVKAISERYGAVPSFARNKNYYYDWGAEAPFSLDGRSEGECSAGTMDMIDFDAGLIKKNREKLRAVSDIAVVEESLYQIALSSSRMLLVTKGVDPKNDQEAFDAFVTHFVHPGPVPASFQDLIELVKKTGPPGLTAKRERILELSEAVLALYNRMDDSLRFREEAAAVSVGESAKGAGVLKEEIVEIPEARKFKDYRNVGCPINFVKVKLDLTGMTPGERLEVWLDDGDPIANVPRSVVNEGHDVISQRKVDTYWSVVIQKGLLHDERVQKNPSTEEASA